MENIAAVVVLYNVHEEVILNINSYRNSVGKIYAVDNSDNADEFIVKKLKQVPNLEYICLNGNRGIAAALNIGANKALNEGYKYLLTMDHDSRAGEDMVRILYSLIKENKNTALVTPEHFNPDIHQKPKDLDKKEILYTMTSGNLINLEVFKDVGEFNEELFIDYVDHEYCLRIVKNGYKIIKTNSTYVIHRLGKSAVKKFFGFRLYPTHHSAIRLYYRTRNRLFVNRIYKRNFPEYVKEDKIHFIREFITMLICDREKFKKLKMIIRGFIDYKKNILGKMSSPADE